jgi:hypothetical protein
MAVFQNGNLDILVSKSHQHPAEDQTVAVEDTEPKPENSVKVGGDGNKLRFIPESWAGNSSYLDATPKISKIVPALDGFVPHIDKVRFPDSWAAVRKMFGAHIDFAFILVFLGLGTWAYVRYIRPQLDRNREGEFVLDENDTTASLLLLPNEEILFLGQEPAAQSW